jgi:hypothetical protein
MKEPSSSAAVLSLKSVSKTRSRLSDFDAHHYTVHHLILGLSQVLPSEVRISVLNQTYTLSVANTAEFESDGKRYSITLLSIDTSQYPNQATFSFYVR